MGLVAGSIKVAGTDGANIATINPLTNSPHIMARQVIVDVSDADKLTTTPSLANVVTANLTLVQSIINAGNHEDAMKVIHTMHGLKYDRDHHILIVDGVARKISKASTYFLDQITTV